MTRVFRSLTLQRFWLFLPLLFGLLTSPVRADSTPELLVLVSQRNAETIAEAATGAWMKLPQLVSDGESKCAVYVEGETQSAILCASIETLGDVSITSESGAGVGWPRFEGSFYLGNGFAPLQWDSEAGVYKAQTTMTFSNLD